jgi:kynureninase
MTETTIGSLTRAHAELLDGADELGPFRDRFLFADPRVIYLDGNSLGMQPKATVTALEQTIERWGRDLILGWRRWIDLPLEIGDLIGAQVLEARPGEVLVSDSTTVNLYKLTLAALSARPGRNVIVTDDENFPTDRYVFDGLAADRGLQIRLVHADPIEGIDPELVAEAVRPDTALVSFSHVSYRSAAIADMQRITHVAHAAGSLVLWDLSHAAGSIPVPLESTGVDLAVGCTYKYLNAGPGAPAYLYVRRDHEALRSPIWGWFGHRDQFAMPPSYLPARGIERFLAGSPNVLSMIGIEQGARLIGEAGIERLRQKAIALTDLIVQLTDAWLVPLGFSVASPRDASRRGSHVSVAHPAAKDFVRRLIKEVGVITDFRPPDRIRIAPVPLTTRFTDVWDGMDRLRQLARSGTETRSRH